MSGPGPPNRVDPLVGNVLGRHVLTRLLGEGGMGAVYEGTHQALGRRAAVKILHERYARSADVRRRFLREGQAASRVRHPNIVSIFDVGAEGDQPYLVMEFLEGEDLGRFIAREGRLSAELTADLLLPVIAAAAAAHELGVVHRDLKPENVFLAARRGRVEPKVLDFGISKVVTQRDAEPITGMGAFLGTPHYMSPEQAQGAKCLDHRSDQYSLGVILYQCTTGRRPVDEPSLYGLIERIVRSDFPAPRELNPGLSSEFEAIVLRAMAHDPEARFPSTRALGRALLEFASERARVYYADEFSIDPHSVTASAPAAPSGEARRLGTTLGDSVNHRDVARPPRPTRRWLTLGAATALLALGFVVLRSAGSSYGVDVSAPIAAVPFVATKPAAAATPLPSSSSSARPSTERPADSRAAPTRRAAGK